MFVWSVFLQRLCYLVKLTAFIVSFLLAFSIYAQETHIVHCFDGGCPTGTPTTNDLVVREIYALSNNRATKFADWVAYRVTRDTFGTTSSLDRDYRNDDLLSAAETLETGDYRNAHRDLGTDRGHMAPLAAFAGTVFWRSTNFLSNITPQKSELNQGPWANLEGAVRDVAYEEYVVYVVTGPIHGDDDDALTLPEADETHQVPTGYFKVIANRSGHHTAFLFDQDVARRYDYCNALTTLAAVETASGLTLMPRNAYASTRNLDEQLGCE